MLPDGEKINQLLLILLELEKEKKYLLEKPQNQMEFDANNKRKYNKPLADIINRSNNEN